MILRRRDEWENGVGNLLKKCSFDERGKTTFRLMSLSGTIVLLINRSITVAKVLLRLKHILLDPWHVLKIGFAERGLWS